MYSDKDKQKIYYQYLIKLFSTVLNTSCTVILNLNKKCYIYKVRRIVQDVFCRILVVL